MTVLAETTFTQRLIQENELVANDFSRWVFVPGMAFGSTIKWWGDEGQRERPHEGVDLCLYEDRQGKLHRLPEQTRLPAICGGRVVRTCDDFLGRSIMIEDDLRDGGKLYAMYGHTVPRPDLEVGQIVREGDIIAYLAPLPPHKTDILPHLHVSLGWAPGTVPPEQLDWERIPDLLDLIDPVQVLNGGHATISTVSWPELLQRLRQERRSRLSR
jgi:hypothetical protein